MTKHGDDGDKLAAVDEEHGERELTQQCASDGIMLDWKLSGILRDAIKDRVQFSEKARDQGWIARVIPCQRVIDVELRAWLNNEAGHDQRGGENLRSSSARTSLQGRPAVGFAR